MTSRNLFFKLMKEDFKRRLWVVTLIGLVCFFLYPVAAAFMRSEEHTSELQSHLT